MQKSALKRPTARNAESYVSHASKRSAQGALAQMLNASSRVVAQRALAVQLNRGGLPENLRNGVERLSGVSMAGVKVHYNSSKPSQLNAEAYAQGRDIHLAPGKEHHLPHEAWHVAQQVKSRVKPTMQMKKPTLAPTTKPVPVNDDKRLEKEADTMGKKAATLGAVAQRAVPETDDLDSEKPAPQTDECNPQGADELFVLPNDYERVAFIGKTRDHVLENAHPFVRNGRIESVRVASGTQENVKGVQIDHRYSWHNIANNMHSRNQKAAAANKGNYSKWWYSLREARLYYNDYTNLQPVLASDNAAAQEHGFQNVVPPVHNIIASLVRDTHGAWMQLQRDFNRVDSHPNSSEGLAEHVVERITGIKDFMIDTSDVIEAELNPPQVQPDIGGGGGGLDLE